MKASPTRRPVRWWLLLLAGLLLPALARAADAADAELLTLAAPGAARLEYRLHRQPQARTTLIFENGLGLTLATWQRLLPALSDCCQWLIYNRVGIGRSESLSDANGSSEPAADERLQHLLQALDLPPPYVLVGHSLGGQYVQRYAQQHPEQVAGLLLVDALPLGAARPYDQIPWLTRVGLWLFTPATLRREIAAIHPMGQQLLAGPGRYAGPMLCLVAEQDGLPKPQGLVKDLLQGVVYAEDFGIWAMDPEAAEARMGALYPQAERRTLRGHHRLQEQAPEQVTAAIHDLLARVAGRPGAVGPDPSSP